jgi:hypothetical protein
MLFHLFAVESAAAPALAPFLVGFGIETTAAAQQFRKTLNARR